MLVSDNFSKFQTKKSIDKATDRINSGRASAPPTTRVLRTQLTTLRGCQSPWGAPVRINQESSPTRSFRLASPLFPACSRSTSLPLRVIYGRSDIVDYKLDNGRRRRSVMNVFYWGGSWIYGNRLGAWVNELYFRNADSGRMKIYARPDAINSPRGTFVSDDWYGARYL